MIGAKELVRLCSRSFMKLKYLHVFLVNLEIREREGYHYLKV